MQKSLIIDVKEKENSKGERKAWPNILFRQLLIIEKQI